MTSQSDFSIASPSPLKLSLYGKRASAKAAVLSTLAVLILGSGMSASSATTPSTARAPQKSTLTTASTPLRISADQQSYDMEHKKYALTGHVIVNFQDMRISGSKALVDMDTAGKPQVARFFNRPLFKRTLPKGIDTVVGDIINVYMNEDRYAAQGKVESHIASAAKDPFYIRSDVQEFDNRNKVVSASGNVQVDYQQSKAWSSLANVRMNEAGKAERVIFSGGAKIQRDNGDVQGEKITILVDSGNMLAERNVHSRVDLKNPAQSKDPKQVFLTSDYQQYDKATQTVLASGHVKIVYGDYIAVGPKATFKLVNQELDKIYLTGRPTITEKDRVVTADRITITTHPRNFDAVGNVKTAFKTTQAPGAAPSVAPSGGAKKPATAGSVKPTTGTKPAAGATTKPVDDPTDY